VPGAVADLDSDEAGDGPWWRDPEIVLPIVSVAAFSAGLVCGWAGARTAASVVFWIGLIAGGATFAPEAVRDLLARGKLGIGLLMTISAIGAVLLGQVEEAAALAFLYSISEALEDKAMDRARSGLRALLRLVPQTAAVQRGGTTLDVPAADLQVGDVLIVRAGERVATDGIIRAGHSSLDTSAITGESIPVEAGPGEEVCAGAIATTGALEIEATAAGADNSLTTIVRLVEQAQTEKGQRARLADRIARPLVPGVMVLAVFVGALGSVLGEPQVWITRALVVLVAASPCALAIAVPVTVVSAIGAASRFGVVIKSGAAFERFGEIRHVALDKTGTLTRNRPTVTHIETVDGISEAQLLSWAAAVERGSVHPLAAAICAAAPDAARAEDIVETAGQGIGGLVGGARIIIGSPRRLDAGRLADRVESLEAEGATVVIVRRNGVSVGVIGIRDELRPESAEAVAALERTGIGVTMLTGDNARTARALGLEAGIEDVRAELRPQDKAEAIRQMSRSTPTAMIGDGINDAPALAAADLGIAMGATGSDAAIESADVAFTGRDLRLLPQAFAHTRRGRQIMNENLVLAILIIACLLPLAITGVLGLAQVVLIHEGAEVVVILNGLRAARIRVPAGRRDEPAPDRGQRTLRLNR
jgi:cation-transporting ATPase G